MGLSQEETKTLRALVYLSSSLSLCACSLVIFSYTRFREVRSVSLGMVFTLSIINFFTSAGTFLNEFYDDSGIDDSDKTVNIVCQIQGGIIQFFNVANLTWMITIATTLFRCIMGNNPRFENPECYNHFIGWGPPVVTTIIVYAKDELGPAGLWCWITDEHDLSRFLFMYIPMLVSLGLNIILYASAYRYLTKLKEEHDSVGGKGTYVVVQFRRKLSKRLMRVVLAFVCSWFWPAVNRIQNWIEPDDPKFWLFCLHAFLGPSFGLAISLVYGTSKKVKKQFRELFRTRLSTTSKMDSATEMSGMIP